MMAEDRSVSLVRWVTPLLAGVIAIWAGPAARSQDAPVSASQPETPAESPTESEATPEVTLILKDTQQVTGLRVDVTTEDVVLLINGIRVPYPMDEIARIHVHEPVMKRYESMRAAVGDNPAQILQLARWLRDRERYDLAVQEAKRAAALDPSDPAASQLVTELIAVAALKAKSRAGDREGRAGRSRRTRPERPEYPLLTDEQVALIKVYEVRLENPPRMLIERETITKLFESHADSSLIPATQTGRDAMYRWAPDRVLDLMFRLRARELYREVRILDELPAMVTFRDQINRGWLTSGCATDRCHGGREAGRFWLYNQNTNVVRGAYTNYLVLERFRVGDESLPLLNFEDPEESVLIQYALPREETAMPHPVVPHEVSGRDTWRPVFRSRRDRRMKRVIDWIDSMYSPHPEYPVEFEPPEPPPVPVPDDGTLPPEGDADGDAGADPAEPEPRD